MVHDSFTEDLQWSFVISGTLDPSVHSVERKPRRDLSTILHILNDLLNAVPHYQPHSFLHAPQRSATDPQYTGQSATQSTKGGGREGGLMLTICL